MPRVMVVCDACKKIVDGIEDENGTSGFYRGPYWEKFMEPGEHILCDDCMQGRATYQVTYPVVKG